MWLLSQCSHLYCYSYVDATSVMSFGWIWRLTCIPTAAAVRSCCQTCSSAQWFSFSVATEREGERVSAELLRDYCLCTAHRSRDSVMLGCVAGFQDENTEETVMSWPSARECVSTQPSDLRSIAEGLAAESSQCNYIKSGQSWWIIFKTLVLSAQSSVSQLRGVCWPSMRSTHLRSTVVEAMTLEANEGHGHLCALRKKNTAMKGRSARALLHCTVRISTESPPWRRLHGPQHLQLCILALDILYKLHSLLVTTSIWTNTRMHRQRQLEQRPIAISST